MEEDNMLQDSSTLKPMEEEDSDEGDDVHQCGRCQKVFTSISEYVQHKSAKNCAKVKAPNQLASLMSLLKGGGDIPALLKAALKDNDLPENTQDLPSIKEESMKAELDDSLDVDINEPRMTRRARRRKAAPKKLLNGFSDEEGGANKDDNEATEDDMALLDDDEPPRRKRGRPKKGMAGVVKRRKKFKGGTTLKTVKRLEDGTIWSNFKIKCPLCPEGFHHKYQLKKHLVDQHASDAAMRKFECEQCGEGFPKRKKYYVHLREAHNVRDPDVLESKCIVCDKIFKQKNHVYRHKESVHSAIQQVPLEQIASLEGEGWRPADEDTSDIEGDPGLEDQGEDEFSLSSERLDNSNAKSEDESPQEEPVKKKKSPPKTDLKLKCFVCCKIFRTRSSFMIHMQAHRIWIPEPSTGATNMKGEQGLGKIPGPQLDFPMEELHKRLAEMKAAEKAEQEKNLFPNPVSNKDMQDLQQSISCIIDPTGAAAAGTHNGDDRQASLLALINAPMPVNHTGAVTPVSLADTQTLIGQAIGAGQQIQTEFTNAVDLTPGRDNHSLQPLPPSLQPATIQFKTSDLFTPVSGENKTLETLTTTNVEAIQVVPSGEMQQIQLVTGATIQPIQIAEGASITVIQPEHIQHQPQIEQQAQLIPAEQVTAPPQEIIEQQLEEDMKEEAIEPLDTKAALEQMNLDVDRRWLCPYCLQFYNSLTEIYNHKREYHSLIPVYQCIHENCREIFYTYAQYENHEKHHKQRAFTCLICNIHFFSLTALVSHKGGAHRNFHAMDTSTRCTICHMAFKSPHALRSHVLTDHNHHQCPQCGKVVQSKADLEDHQSKHSGIKAYLCDQCGAKFSSKMALARHRTSHDPTKFHKCPQCDSMFHKREHLRRHLGTKHTTEKPFECTFPGCSKAFKRKDKLNQHLKTHSDTNSYVCDVCGKGFKYREGLRCHEKTHKKENKHFCTVCDAGFIQAKQLRLHLRRDHGLTVKDARPCECSVCGHLFSRPFRLKRHMEHKHGVQPDWKKNCPYCQKGFAGEKSMQSHMLKRHGIAKGTEELPPEALLQPPVAKKRVVKKAAKRLTGEEEAARINKAVTLQHQPQTQQIQIQNVQMVTHATHAGTPPANIRAQNPVVSVHEQHILTQQGQPIQQQQQQAIATHQPHPNMIPHYYPTTYTMIHPGHEAHPAHHAHPTHPGHFNETAHATQYLQYL